MWSPISTARPHAPSSDAPGAPEVSPTQQGWLQSLLRRDRNGTKKPLDFAKLDKAHQAWKAAGGDRSNPRAGEVGRMAAHYLDWAEQQPASTKRTKRCERARQMLAEAGGTPRPSRSSAPTSPTARTNIPASGRSIGDRLRGTVQKAAVFSKGAVERLTQARPDGIDALQGQYNALKASGDAGTFEPAQARQVREMASAFIERESGADTRIKVDQARIEVAQAKIELAQAILRSVDDLTLKARREEQAVIDASYRNLPGDSLTERGSGRERHAQALFDLARRYGDRREDLGRAVPDADGHVVYRLHPMPPRSEQGQSIEGPQNAALLSALNHALRAALKVDFGIPDATPATLDGTAGVLVDGDNLLLDGSHCAELVEKPALQRAVLMQWLIGQPRAGWDQLLYDQRGLLRPASPAMRIGTAKDLARCTIDGGPPTLFEHPFRSGQALHGQDDPVDDSLRQCLAALDLQAVHRSLKIAQDSIDVTFARKATEAGLPIQHHAYTANQTVSQLQARLRALKTAMGNQSLRPLAQVLVDASKELLEPGSTSRKPVHDPALNRPAQADGSPTPPRRAPAWRRAFSAIGKPVRRVARFIAELPARFMRHIRSSRGERPATGA